MALSHRAAFARLEYPVAIDREALKAFKAAPAPRQSLSGKPVAPSPAVPVPSVIPADTSTQDPPAAPSAPAAVVDASVADPAASAPAPAPASATADPPPAGDPQAAPSGGTTPEGEQPPVGRARERIEDLHAQLKATREYAEYQARVIQDLTTRTAAPNGAAAPTSAPAAPAVTDDPPPTLEQHEFDAAKLAKAQAEWLQRQVDKRVTAAMQGHTAQQQAEATRQQFTSRMEAFKASAPDFDVVVANPALPPLSPTAARLVVASEKGPALVYHLAKNPNVAAHIARMAPEQQAMAIGRLEAQLAAPAAAAPPARQKTTTQAPPPPSPTPAGGNSGGSRNPADMPMKDFVENERRLAADKRARLKARRA